MPSYPDCSCCGATTGSCPECPGPMAARLSVSLSGITNGTCTNCADLNRSMVMTAQGEGACSWNSSPDFTNPCPGGIFNYWTISLDESRTQWVLGCNLGAVYQVAVDSWDCQSLVDFILTSVSDNFCLGWPATLRVTPV
jgi:hypothetical protein